MLIESLIGEISESLTMFHSSITGQLQSYCVATNLVMSAIVFEVLTKENYATWSACVRNYLLGQDLWDIIETESKPRKNSAKFNSWRKKDAMALHAIQISCGPDILFQIKDISTAKAAWDELAKMYKPQSRGVVESESSASQISCRRDILFQIKDISTAKAAWDELAKMYKPQSQGVVESESSARDPSTARVKSHEPQSQGVSEPLDSVGDSGISEIQEPQVPRVFEAVSSLDNPAQKTFAGTETNDYAQYEPLVKAVKSGNWDVVKGFIDKHQNAVRERLTSEGAIALHYAVLKDHVKIVEELVQLMSKQDLAIQDNNGSTALHHAVYKGHVKIVEDLLQLMSKEDLRIQDIVGVTALHVAAFVGQVKIAEELVRLMSKQDLAIRDIGGNTALHVALDKGHVKIVEELVRSMSKEGLTIQGINGATALHKAALAGQVKIVEELMRFISEQDLAIQDKDGHTALHIAVFQGHVEIAKKLVQSMLEPDLAIQDDSGLTALMYATSRGFKQLVASMVKKNKNLVSIAEKGMIPVVKASVSGHNDLVRYLYSLTPLAELTREKRTNGATLLSYRIFSAMFDVALDLLQKCRELVVAEDMEGNSPLYVLCGMPSAFQSGSQLVFWQRWIYPFLRVQPTPPTNYIRIDIPNPDLGEADHPGSIVTPVFDRLHWLLSYFLKVFRIKHMYDRKLIHVQALQLLHLICKEEMPALFSTTLNKAFFHAIKNGIVEIVMELTKANVNLLWGIDNNRRGILQCAIVHRQEKIFSLVYGLDARDTMLMIPYRDQFHNTMLHLAGMLISSTQLDRISGAALQMQRELQWFKEVESIVHPMSKELLNSDDKSPRELFSEEHKKLAKEGRRWMKETATSCAFVGALIVTIMFTAAFTVPGGNNQESGFPIVSNKKLFQTFILSDAISFLSATTSILVFLGILTSRYSEEDFLKSLPTKMIIGLTTLFISIASMIIAFCATIFLMLHGQMLGIFIPVLIFASVPIIIFVVLQFPLFVEIFMSTYGPSIFNRNTKCWYK